MPKFFGSLFFYFTTDMGHDAFESPLPMWFPFDCENLTEYLIAVMIQYAMTRYTFVVVAAGAALATGGFLLAISIIEEIKIILKSVNKEAKSKKNHLNVLIRISDFIRIHSTLKQIIYDFVGIFQLMLVAIFIWSLLTICGTMLMFQVELSRGNIDSVVLFATIFYAGYALGTIFIACELGQRLSNTFDEICDQMERFNWYSFPDELKAMLPIIIIVVQHPVEINCFESITCSRESFKKVIKSSYSYSTVLRTLYK